MSESRFEATKRSTIRRLPQRGSYERDVVYAILDQGLVCHVGFVTDQGPVVIPMGYARREEEILLHGSARSRLLNELEKGIPVAIAVTLVDGLVLARSHFHHSINYRSVVLFGRAVPVVDPDEKAEALLRIVEHLVPGRSGESRAPDEGELRATRVVRVPIDEASAKIRSGPPADEARDLSLDVWAGVLPFQRRPGTPIADPHTRPEIPLPDSVLRYPEDRT